jgi:hypothetical protein
VQDPGWAAQPPREEREKFLEAGKREAVVETGPTGDGVVRLWHRGRGARGEEGGGAGDGAIRRRRAKLYALRGVGDVSEVFPFFS